MERNVKEKTVTSTSKLTGLDDELVQAIIRVFTTMHETEAGSAALELFQTTKFDEFPQGIEAATARMREMMELVRDVPLP